MRKKIIILSLILCSFFLISCKSKEDKKTDDFVSKIEKLSSYNLEGNLKSFYPSGEKDCKISVIYLKPSYYYVEITNPETNEIQIIVKNSDGVYIGIPMLNKTFKIKTNWPLNSSYPYILESVVNDIKTATDVIKKQENDKTILEMKVKIFDNNTSEKERIIIDKKGKLEEIIIYDQDDKIINDFKVTSFKSNIDVKENFFDINESIQTIQTSLFEIEYEKTISYPSYFPEGTHLVDELIKRNKENTYAILKYGGTSSYTIIEQYVSKNESLITTECDGNIFIFNAIPVITSSNYILFVDGGIEYKIASETISVFEMIKMADSLTIVSEK